MTLVALAALLTSSLGALSLPAAIAAEPGDVPVEYSLDGAHWSAAPPTAIFPDTWQPVPGAETTATLYVRAARAGMTVVGVYLGQASASDASLLAATTVTGDGGRVVALDAIADCAQVAAQTVLADGEVLAVPLTVGIAADLTTGQQSALSVSLQLELSDTGVPTLSGGCPVDPEIIAAFPAEDAPGNAEATNETATATPLARTGADAPLGLAVAALTLVGAGAAALAASIGARRRAR